MNTFDRLVTGGGIDHDHIVLADGFPALRTARPAGGLTPRGRC